MMTSLFMAFEPSSAIPLLNLNWMFTMFIVLSTMSLFYMESNRLESMMHYTIMVPIKECKILTKKMGGHCILLSSMFMFILITNLTGLLPYTYTTTTQMALTMSMAVPMWLGIMLMNAIYTTMDMFSHLTPRGTPKPLILVMITIETVSLMIRPLTLSIRLFSNMVAGHLLLMLVGEIMDISHMMMQIPLIFLESMVSCVQAYVFTMLMTLYSSEVLA